MGLNEEVLSVINSSCAQSTYKQYEVYYNQWKEFCHVKRFIDNDCNVKHVLEFLMSLYKEGKSYSTINAARSALSYFFNFTCGKKVGEDMLVVRFMKGVFRLRPPRPKYDVTWSADKVLLYLRSIKNNDCDLKSLTFKTVALLALVTGQRVQTLASIKLNNVVFGDVIQIRLTSILKTTSLRNSNPVLKLPPFNDVLICPVAVLKDYCSRTASLRKSDDLFVSFMKPYGPVSSQTISRWLCSVLKLSGIDVSVYGAHSFRSSSTSKAKESGVSTDTILKRIGWSANSQTFAIYYNRVVEQEGDYAAAVLS